MKKNWLIVVLTIVLLVGCQSRQVLDLQKQIETVAQMDTVSREDILWIINAYNNLSPSDKLEVKNYDKIYDLQARYYHNRIISIVKESNLDKMMELKEEINTLDNTVINRIDNLQFLYDSIENKRQNDIVSEYNERINVALRSSNYEDLSSAFDAISFLEPEIQQKLSDLPKLKETLSSEVVNKINTMSSSSEVAEMYSIISKYKLLLSEDQLLECFIRYARFNGVNEAEAYIKSKLKSPKSYYRYECSLYPADLQKDGGYTNTYKIKYSGENAFGGSVTKTELVHIKFFLDLDTLEVDYAYVGDGGPGLGIEHWSAPPTKKK